MFYTGNMDITDWDNDEILHLVMAKGHITQKALLEILLQANKEKMPQSTFSSKIRRNALKVSELQTICKLLGYTITIKKQDKNL